MRVPLPRAMEQHEKTDLSGCDREILVKIIDIIPELRICAEAAMRARAANVQYPIEDHKSLSKLLKEEVYESDGHTITRPQIRELMTSELFPIDDEEDLVRKVYMGLLRCRETDENSSVNRENIPQDLDNSSSNTEQSCDSKRPIRVVVEIGGA